MFTDCHHFTDLRAIINTRVIFFMIIKKKKIKLTYWKIHDQNDQQNKIATKKYE